MTFALPHLEQAAWVHCHLQLMLKSLLCATARQVVCQSCHRRPLRQLRPVQKTVSCAASIAAGDYSAAVSWKDGCPLQQQAASTGRLPAAFLQEH